jgi:NAD(P)-dependent dehydrogenase (short-subunit alcohol dehydrogenase family)
MAAPTLYGRVALVTGGGTGLGRAYALWLADHGAKVVVNNRVHPEVASSAAAVADEIRRMGGEAAVDEHSVESELAGRAMVDVALQVFGRLDIVVTNAGVLSLQECATLDLDTFRRVMDINFWGSVYPVLAALPLMIDRNYGRIVMTVSTAGLFGQAKSAAYGASRSAIIGFARSTAVETLDHGNIRVNMVSPSAYTNASSVFHDPSRAYLMSPEKVAPVVGWLSSEACGRTGLILHAGCGLVRRLKIVDGPALPIVDDDVWANWPQLDLAELDEAAYASAAGAVLRTASGG